MRHAFLSFVPWLLALCWPGLALGQQDAERAQLNAQRRVLTQRFSAEENACQQRFAVTACVDDVRVRRREALAPLRERELRLDEAERMQRAQEREAARSARRAALASSLASAPPAQAPVAASANAPTRVPPAPSTPRLSEAQRQQAAEARAAQAAQRAQDTRRRNEEAKAAQAQVARRQAQRQAAGSLPTPLPRDGRAEGAAPAASQPRR